MCMPTSTVVSSRTVIIGVALAMWILLALVSPWMVLAESRSTPVGVCLNVWGWGSWLVVAVALLVPSSISLTAVRIIVPVSVVASIASTGVVAIFASVVIGVIALSAMFCDVMVQGDAYGDERRFSLRTPVPQMAPAVVAWACLVAPALVGTLGLCAGQWQWAAPVSAIGLVAAVVIPRRLHRLARRWLVIVPAGVVLHDHVVLGETLMVTRSRLANVGVADGPGDAADLTGGVLGRRLDVELVEADKVVLSDITAKLLGTTVALHVKTFSCAPRRLDAALSAVRR